MTRAALPPLVTAPAATVRAAPPHDRRWRVARLLSAPHRLGFSAAALLMAATALWWLAALVARAAGLALPWAVPPPAAHGLALSLGFMPLFIAGFLFTAGPRWLGLPEVPARTLLRPVLAMVGGWALALPGFHVAAPLAGLGLVAATIGWLAVLGRFARLAAASPVPDRLHAKGVLAAGVIGALAMGAGALGVGLEQWDLARAAALLAVWGFLAPTFTIVSHRMLPFFTASALPWLEAWRPNWLLGAMLFALGMSAAGEVAGALWWPLPPTVHAALAAVQAPAALLALWLALRWGLLHSLRQRLLAMLHGGFVWFGVALALAALSHALAARGSALRRCTR